MKKCFELKGFFLLRDVPFTFSSKVVMLFWLPLHFIVTWISLFFCEFIICGCSNAKFSIALRSSTNLLRTMVTSKAIVGKNGTEMLKKILLGGKNFRWVMRKHNRVSDDDVYLERLIGILAKSTF